MFYLDCKRCLLLRLPRSLLLPCSQPQLLLLLLSSTRKRTLTNPNKGHFHSQTHHKKRTSGLRWKRPLDEMWATLYAMRALLDELRPLPSRHDETTWTLLRLYLNKSQEDYGPSTITDFGWCCVYTKSGRRRRGGDLLSSLLLLLLGKNTRREKSIPKDEGRDGGFFVFCCWPNQNFQSLIHELLLVQLHRCFLRHATNNKNMVIMNKCKCSGKVKYCYFQP